MPKKLLIIRHGRAESTFSGTQDFQRNLTESGEADAIEIAERLLQKNQVPALMVSSNAKRAHKTAQLFAATWNIPVDAIQLIPQIYEATYTTLLSVVTGLDNNYDFIALFGHNPGLTDFLNYIADAGLLDLDTSGAAVVSFEANNWLEISAGAGKVALLIEP